jgi:UMF1 family MFS transporter
MGYLGGGLLLLGNLALFQLREPLGLDTGMAVRLNLASAGLWWLGWSFWTWATLRSRHAPRALPPGESYLTVGFKQLRQTFSEAHKYPHTIRYLLAYLIYNDGIQTVIAVAAIFAAAPVLQGGLGIETGTLTLIILMIQFVAFFGALFWGRLAGWIGAKNALIVALTIWSAVVIYAYFGMQGDSRVTEFWVLGAFIALVMGGSQAISRSLFAQMIPPGKEAEFFSIYEISERGTSWIGPLIFGLVNQWLGNLRPAILSLIFFFVVGLVLLVTFVNVPRAIAESGQREARAAAGAAD